MTDKQKITIIKALLLGAFEDDMIGNVDERCVGYMHGLLEAIYEILSMEGTDDAEAEDDG